MVVLGCDPGLAKGAVAVLHVSAGRPDRPQLGSVVKIRSKPGIDVHQRLLSLQVEVMQLVERTGAVIAVVEKTHLGAGTGSSLALSQARGCWLAGIAAGNPRIVLVELTPSQVKKAVAGHGSASKGDVAEAVARRFPSAAGISHDESDAIAIALAGLQLGVH